MAIESFFKNSHFTLFYLTRNFFVFGKTAALDIPVIKINVIFLQARQLE